MVLDPLLLLRAYAIGVFPMSDDREADEIYWVEPKTRAILPLNGFHLSRSLGKVLKSDRFRVSVNADFAQVVRLCAESASDRPTTWINLLILTLYQELHRMGYTHSVEAWDGEELVGGLYGLSLGSAFFGESMFSRRTDASKICLVHLVERLKARGFTLLDTQFTTEHLKSFGAIDVPRKDYEKLLEKAMRSEDLSFAG